MQAWGEKPAGERAVAAVALFAALGHDGHHGLVALHGEDRSVQADCDPLNLLYRLYLQLWLAAQRAGRARLYP